MDQGMLLAKQVGALGRQHMQASAMLELGRAADGASNSREGQVHH